MRRITAPPFCGPIFLSIFLLACTPLHAQTAPPAGTSVAVRMLDAVDSSRDPAGKQYRASVTKAVDAGNGVMIPQGAVAAVTLVNSNNGSGWTAQLVSVTVNGQPVAVTSGSASVTAAAQTAAGNAVSSLNSMLGGFGHHVNAPAAATAIATGQRVVLPLGTTLSFVLSQPPASSPASTVPAASAGQAAPVQQTASAAPAPAPNPAPGPPAVAAPGQHWWLCRYVDPKDIYKAVLGSRVYFAVFPDFDSNAASLGEVGGMAYSTAMVKHFIGYVRENYTVTALAGNPTGQYTGNVGGFCKRASDDAASRAYSVDLMKKQFPSNHFEGIQVDFADTPAQDAPIDAKLASEAAAAAKAAATPTAAANQKYAWCHSAWAGVTGTKLPAGTVLYFSDVFAETIPSPPPGATPPGGKTGNGWAQANADTLFQAPFIAFLKKQYGKDVGADCSAWDPPTQAGLQNAQRNKQQFEDMTKQLNGQVVETGWSGH